MEIAAIEQANRKEQEDFEEQMVRPASLSPQLGCRVRLVLTRSPVCYPVVTGESEQRA